MSEWGAKPWRVQICYILERRVNHYNNAEHLPLGFLTPQNKNCNYLFMCYSESEYESYFFGNRRELSFFSI